MFHRESGVFKTSYAADMALYPLPIAKWAVAAFAGLFIVIAPLTLGDRAGACLPGEQAPCSLTSPRQTCRHRSGAVG